MLTVLTLLQESDQAQGSPLGGLIGLILGVIVLAGVWKVFAKAGKPGWYAIIPILNTFTLVQIAGKPWWWFLLLFIPFVNFIIVILVMLDLAKAFGKGALYAVGLILLSPIFLPLLGFGDAQYQGARS